MDRNEAIKVIKDNWPEHCHQLSEALKTIIPEFQESEDEIVRKKLLALIEWSKSYAASGITTDEAEGMIAWLKKQGEQKPTNKVEPKFKVGDWAVWNGHIICHIDNIYQGKESLMYTISTNRVEWSDSVKKFDTIAHLWTIQDATDGDILRIHSSESNSDCIFLYQNTYEIEPNRNVAVAHCCIDVYTNKIEFGIQGPDCIDVRNIKPATKEQRDLLLQKMKEVGYEWDAEEKKLKKIEQKSVWSEEDEKGLGDALWAIEQARTIAKDENDMGNLWYAEYWLKSLEQRIKRE